MIWRFGLLRWWRYEQTRRTGLVIDWARVFTADELALLAEYHVPAPWERFSMRARP